MVAFVTGSGLGLTNTSLAVLGSGGTVGNAFTGRSAELAYVNTATGNLVVQRQDEMLVAAGPDISILRTYNSQGMVDGDNNDGWRMGVHKTVGTLVGTANAVGSSITRTDGDGVSLVYRYDAERAAYINADGAGAYDKLTYDAGQVRWTWTDGDTALAETYDWSSGVGKLLSSVDLDGNKTNYSYNSNKQVTSVKNTTSGETTYLDYASGGKLSAIRTVKKEGSNNVTLTRVRYTYDTNSRLKTVAVDLSPDDNAASDGNTYVTTYGYDSAGRVNSISQKDGSLTTIAYVGGRVSEIVQVVAGVSRTTTLTYDDANHKTSVTDPLGLTTVFTHDDASRLVELQGPSVSGDGGRSTLYQYDELGNVTRQTDAGGSVIEYQYDEWGNQTAQRSGTTTDNGTGNTITRTFGSRNQLLSETLYLTPDPDGEGAATAGGPQVTRYAYSSKNHLRFMVTAQGRVSEYRYDAKGQCIASIDYAGNSYTSATVDEASLAAWVTGTADKTRSVRVDTTYDFRGLVDTIVRYASVGADGTGATSGKSTTKYVYDQAGLLLQTITPNGSSTASATDGITTYTYDGLGRQLTAKDALGNINVNSYDDAGNRTVSTLANGLATTYVYSAAGELLTVARASGATALGTTQHWYDAAGRLRMSKDPTGVLAYSLYDEAGRKVADIDGNGSLVEFVYNANDQVVSSVRYASALSAGDLASLVDAAGNPTSVTLGSVRPGPNAGDRQAWNFYDAGGRLVKSVDELGYVTQTTYDGMSRAISSVRYATRFDGSITPSTTAADVVPAEDATSDRRTRFFHDADSRLVGTLDADGFLVVNEYDAAGRLVHTVAYATQTGSAYRATGTLVQLTPLAVPAGDVHSWTLYDGQNRVVAVVDPEGYLTESEYDLSGNVVRQLRYAAKAKIAPASITQSTTLAALRPTSTTARIITWTYTDLNQVATTTDPEGTITRFTYDVVGNLVQTDRAWNTSDVRTQRTRFDALGNIIGELTGEGSVVLAALPGSATTAQINAVWSSYGTTYAYDAAGRRITETDANGSKTRLYYDADGRLVYRINALGEVERNTYDALGQVAQTTRYGARLAGAALATLSGGLVTSSVDTLIGAIANAVVDSKVTFTYDARGQIIGRTDELGNATSMAYNGFGDLRSTSRSTGGAELTTQNTYDRRGLRTGALETAGGLSRSTQTDYDAFGRVVRAVDAQGHEREWNFDRLGQVVSTEDGLGASSFMSYDAYGRLLVQTDRNGNKLTSTYNDTARSMTVTTDENVSVTTTRTRHGQTLTLTDGNLIATTYTYDRNGNLKSTTNGLGLMESAVYDNADRLKETVDANGTRTTYTYDAANRVLTRTLDEAPAPNGLNLQTTYTYDANGQQLTITDPKGVVTLNEYDLKGQLLSVTVDANGMRLKTSYGYDAMGHTLTVTQDTGGVMPRVTTYEYDPLGRRIREILDPAGRAFVTHYAYDESDNLVARTDAEGHVTRYVYDAENRVTHQVDAAGNITSYSYFAEGGVRQIRRYAQPMAVAGLPLEITSADVALQPTALDAVLHSVYDKDGKLRYEVNGLGEVTERRYDKNGNVIQRISYAKRLTASALTTLAATGSLAAAPTADALDQSQRLAYDAANRLVYTADAVGTFTERVYDKVGNVILRRTYSAAVTVSTTFSLTNVGAALANKANSADQVQRTVYDAASRPVYDIDALGVATELQYDKTGNLVSTRRFANALSLGALGTEPTAATVKGLLVADDSNDRISRHVYDAVGRPIYGIDARGAVTESRYDRLGHLVGTVQYATTIPVSTAATASAVDAELDLQSAAAHTQDRITTFAYDAAGRMTSATDALGQTESYTYDGTGNKTSFTNKLGAQWTYEYDAAGRQVAEISPLVSVARITLEGGTPSATVVSRAMVTLIAYDGLGNVISRTEGARASGAQSLEDSRTTEYRYDAAGRQTQTIFPEVNVYNVASPVKPTVTVTYDALGNAIANKDVGGKYSAKVYDAAGRVLWDIDANGYITGYTRDNFGNVKSLTRYAEAMDTVLGAAGVTDSAVRSSLKVNAADRVLTTQYDALGRAVKVTEPIAYTYDQNDLSGEVFDASRVTATSYSTLGDVLRTSVYGANSVGVAKTVAADTYFKYDVLGQKIAQLAVYERAAGANTARAYATTFTYDAVGNLTEQVEYAKYLTLSDSSWSNKTGIGYTLPTSDANDRKVRFGYDLANRTTSQTRINVVYGETATGARLTGNSVTTYGYDALGNATSTTDATGVTTYTYYDVLGRVTGTATPSLQAMRTRISQLYALLFNKAPDQNGMASWLQKMQSGRTFAEVADEMYQGAQALGVFPANDDGQEALVVSEIYRNALGRDPDSQGLSYWTQALQNANDLLPTDPDAKGKVFIALIDAVSMYGGDSQAGLTSQRVFNAKVAAGVQYALDGGGAAGSTSASAAAALKASRSAEIAQLYMAILGRAPDSASLASHLTQMSAGKSISDIAQTIITGSEAKNLYPTDADDLLVVSRLYQNVYGRPVAPDSAEMNAWLDTLDVVTRGAFVVQLIESLTASTSTASSVVTTRMAFNNKVSAALPADMDALNLPLSPLTRLDLDIYGNAVKRTEFMNGANVATATELDVTGRSGDRISYAAYDTSGHVTRRIDAANHSSYAYYDVYGREAKVSQNVTDVAAADGTAGAVREVYTLTTYDAVGQVTSVTDAFGAQNTASVLENTFNAFGEVVLRKVGGNSFEYFDYDNAGHLWRTNAGDGVDKVMLYDIAGRQTAEIRSAVKNLKTYATAAQVVPAADLVRTNTSYDLLGHVTAQVRPMQYSDEVGSVSGSVLSATRIVTAETATLGAVVTQSGTWSVVSMNGMDNEVWGWTGPNAIDLTWATLAGLGSGDVKVEMTHTTRNESGEFTQTQLYGADEALDGVTLSWYGQPCASISRIKVYKKDVFGNWATLIDRSNLGDYGTSLRIHAPTELTTMMQLKYKLAGAEAWTLVPSSQLAIFGDALVFDTTGLAEGSYAYLVEAQEAGTTAWVEYDTGSVGVTAPAVRRQVAELYVALLNRAPDSGNLAKYVAEVLAGKTLAVVAQEIYNSDESKAVKYYYGKTDTQAVQKFYSMVLGRTADESELAEWIQRASTVTRGQLITMMVGATTSYQYLEGIDTSTDAFNSQQRFVNRVSAGLVYAADYGGYDTALAASILAPITQNAATIQTGLAIANEFVYGTQASQLYVLLFNRAPEPVTFDFWVNRLTSGATLATVAQEMYNSAVTAGVYTSTATATDIVTRLYTGALGRTPDPAGLAQWVQRMGTSGVTKGQVFCEFITAVTGYSGTDATALVSQRLFKNKAVVSMAYARDFESLYPALAPTVAASLLANVTAAATAMEAVNLALTSALQAEASAQAAWAAAVAAKTAAVTASQAAANAVPATQTTAAQVGQLYILLFNRAPDLDGYNSWLARLASGRSFAGVAQEMYASGQTLGTFPKPDTGKEGTVVQQIHQKALGRTADAETLAYWTQQLVLANASADPDAKGKVFVSLIGAVTGYTGTDAAVTASMRLFNNKVAVGLAYAAMGGRDLTTATSVIALVTAADAGVAADSVQAFINTTTAEIASGTANVAAAGAAAASTSVASATAAWNAASAALQAANALIAAAASAATAASAVATADIRSEVARLYAAIYKRAPSLAELNGWVTARTTQSKSGAQIATEMLAANTALYPTSLSASDFVTRIYQNGLGRSPDSAGLTYWANAISGGTSRGSVAHSILTAAAASTATDAISQDSKKYLLGIVTTYLTALSAAADAALPVAVSDKAAAQTRLDNATAPKNAATTANGYSTAIKTQVAQLYAALLNRNVDIAGMNTRGAQLSAGTALTAVAEQILATSEAQAVGLYPTTLTNAEFVNRFYNVALGRNPDQGGWDYWTGRLNAGETRGQVAVAIFSAVATYSGTDAAALGSKTFFNNNVNAGLTNLSSAIDAALTEFTNAQTALTAATSALAMAELAVPGTAAALTAANAALASTDAAKSLPTLTSTEQSTNQAKNTATTQAANEAAANGWTLTTDLRLEVTRLFATLYKRAPTLTELNSWVGARTGGKSASTIATEMLATAEVKVLYPTSQTNNAFVTAIYQNALGRALDTNEWTQQLSAGTSRGQVTLNIIAAVLAYSAADTAALASKKLFTSNVAAYLSPLVASADAAEAAAITALNATKAKVGTGAGAVSGTSTTVTPTATGGYNLKVSQIFMALLQRVPTPAEMTSWVGQMQAGTSFAAVAQQILDSADGWKLYPQGSTKRNFVKTFYTVALGRTADTASLDYWESRLNVITRGKLVEEIIAEVVAYKGANAASLVSQGLLNNNTYSTLVATSTLATAAVTVADAQVAPLESAYRTAADVADALAFCQQKNIATALQQGFDPSSGRTAQYGETPQVTYTADRWGNTLSVSDARDSSWITRYTYNADNQLLDITRPDGKKTGTYYDKLGRVIAERDANGNVNRQRYDDFGHLVEETHADGGIVQYKVDVFGQRLQVREANGVLTAYTYDQTGQTLSAIRAAGFGVDWYSTQNVGTDSASLSSATRSELVETYAYDELGRRTLVTNAAGESVRTYYDARGNVLRTVAPLSRTTVYTYDAYNNKTSEVQAFGTALSVTTSWTYDGWGHVLDWAKTGSADGDNYTFSYDNFYNKLQQLSRQTSHETHSTPQNVTPRGQQDLVYTYDNSSGLLVKIEDKSDASGSIKVTQYAYDLAGNRTREKTSVVSAQGAELDVAQDNHLAYDQLGRLSDINDSRYNVHYDYDANGNRTHVITKYRTPTWGWVATGAPEGRTGEDTETIVESWNTYDAMNRQTIVDGIKDAQGKIVIGNNADGTPLGQEIAYDNAGNQVMMRQYGKRLVAQTVRGSLTLWTSLGDFVTESYAYDAAGRLSDAYRDGLNMDARRYDKAGRTLQSGLLAQDLQWARPRAALEAVGVDANTHISAYDAAGQLKNQSVRAFGSSTNVSDLFNEYDELGRLEKYQLKAGGKVHDFTYTYEEFESSQVRSIVGVRDGQSGATSNTYDANGHLIQVEGDVHNPKLTRTLFNDHQGRVLTKGQDGHITHSLIANGEAIGSSSDSSVPAAEGFRSNYVPISNASLSSGPQTYTVQAGDTLQTIAKTMWGNADLWYLIADANGTSAVTAGQVIVIPSKTSTVYNDFDTFTPYNASEAVGDTTPTIPQPKKKSNWLKQLIMVIIIIVATIFTAGALTVGLSGSLGSIMSAGASALATGAAASGAVLGSAAGVGVFGAGAIAGAVGSIAGQAFGVASGLQDKFNWKGVALSALGGGIAAGMGPTFSPLGGDPTSIGNVMARAALGNAASQGIGVATGLQKSFDWRGVAASAAGAGIGQAVGGALKGVNFGLGDFGNQLARGTLSGLAAGTTAAVMRGGKISIQQVATDAFGNALGSSLADQMSQPSLPLAAAESYTGTGIRLGSKLGLQVSPAAAAGWSGSIDEAIASNAQSLTAGGPPEISLSGDAELRLQLGLSMMDYGDQYIGAGDKTADPNGAVRKQVNGDPSTKSLWKSALNGFVSTGATWLLGGSGPTHVSPQEYTAWKQANPNARAGEMPTAQIDFDIDNFSWKTSIGTTPPIGQQLLNTLSLGTLPVGKGLGNLAGGISVARDEGLSYEIRSQGAYDAGANALSVPAAWLMTGAPGLRFNRSVMGPNDGPQLPAWGGPVDYSILTNSASVGPGKLFTQVQKANIYALNKQTNSGLLRSDLDGTLLIAPSKSQAGVTPPRIEAQVDHMNARVPANPSASPGTNSYGNAQVLSREQNRYKWNY